MSDTHKAVRDASPHRGMGVLVAAQPGSDDCCDTPHGQSLAAWARAVAVLIATVWLAVLLWLLVGGTHSTWLAPRLLIFQWLGVGLLALGLLALCTGQMHAHVESRSALASRLAVLLLPVLALLLGQGRQLGGETLRMRSANNPATLVHAQIDETPAPTGSPSPIALDLGTSLGGPGSATSAGGPALEPDPDDPYDTFALQRRTGALSSRMDVEAGPPTTDQQAITDMDLEQISRQGMALAGRRVRVVGRVENALTGPADRMLLYRFLVTCCVADAEALVLVARHPQVSTLANGAWLSATGVLRRARNPDGSAALLLDADSITTITAPRDIYLYPPLDAFDGSTPGGDFP